MWKQRLMKKINIGIANELFFIPFMIVAWLSLSFILYVSLPREISRANITDDVTIISATDDSLYSQNVAGMLVLFDDEPALTVQYKNNKYCLNDESLVKQYKDDVGKTIKANINVIKMNNGKTKYQIEKLLDWSLE